MQAIEPGCGGRRAALLDHVKPHGLTFLTPGLARSWFRIRWWSSSPRLYQDSSVTVKTGLQVGSAHLFLYRNQHREDAVFKK